MERSTTYTCQCCGKEGIKKAHWKKNKYCSIKCQNDYQRQQRVQKWLSKPQEEKWLNAPMWAKDYLSEQQKGKCNICGITQHNNLPIVFDMDHIDGNPTNNHPNNLQLICPNCHSQQATYKNRNIGNGRQNTRKVLQT